MHGAPPTPMDEPDLAPEPAFVAQPTPQASMPSPEERDASSAKYPHILDAFIWVSPSLDLEFPQRISMDGLRLTDSSIGSWEETVIIDEDEEPCLLTHTSEDQVSVSITMGYDASGEYEVITGSVNFLSYRTVEGPCHSSQDSGGPVSFHLYVAYNSAPATIWLSSSGLDWALADVSILPGLSHNNQTLPFSGTTPQEWRDSDGMLQVSVNGDGNQAHSGFHFVVSLNPCITEIPQIELRPVENAGLLQYAGAFGDSPYRDSVFRRGDLERPPTFEVATNLDGKKGVGSAGRDIVVDIIRNHDREQLYASVKAKWSAKRQVLVAKWDWESDRWGKTKGQVPVDRIPVGEYQAVARCVGDECLEGWTSKEVPFYVIFESPEGLSDDDIWAFLYHEEGLRDEIGVWFSAWEWEAEAERGGCASGHPYLVRPFEFDIFRRVIEYLSQVEYALGIQTTDRGNAAALLAELVHESFEEDSSELWGQKADGVPNDVAYLLERLPPKAQCSDEANLLTAFLRSIGIASRPVTIDTNLGVYKAENPENGRKWWNYHVWTEAFISGKWQAIDAYVERDTPLPALEFGAHGTPTAKDLGDVILRARSDWKFEDLGYLWSGDAKNRPDFEFLYQKNEEMSVPRLPYEFRRTWVEVEDEQFDYWYEKVGDPRVYPPRGPKQQPLLTPDSVGCRIETDQATYLPGTPMDITLVITNEGDSQEEILLTLDVVQIDGSLAMAAQENTLYSTSLPVLLDPHSEVTLTESLTLPSDLDVTDLFYVRADLDGLQFHGSWDVAPGFDATASVPDQMQQHEVSDFSLLVTNSMDTTLNEVAVTLLADEETFDLLSADAHVAIGDLAPGESVPVSWTVQAVNSNWPGVVFQVDSANGGTAYVQEYAEVLLPPRVYVGDASVCVEVESQREVTAHVEVVVSNLGDLPASNVALDFYPDAAITATNPHWAWSELAGGEEVIALTDITFTVGNSDSFVLDVMVTDGEGNEEYGLVWIDVDAGPAEIQGRWIFYNNSFWDTPTEENPTFDNDTALATDKTALRSGETATLANYTSYDRGINGIMIDVANLPEGDTLGPDNFQFRVGNSEEPDSWIDAPHPSNIRILPSEGVGESDRVAILWDDYAVTNQWLQVTLLATEDTGLLESDIFYFGNATGETGNSATNAKVNAIDALLARNNPHNVVGPAQVTSPYDFNRDARVNATDMLIARNNQTHLFDALKLISVPESKGIASSTARLDIHKGAPYWSTHDTVLETTSSRESEATSPKLHWLFEFQQTQRQPEKTNQKEEAVDKLLQM